MLLRRQPDKELMYMTDPYDPPPPPSPGPLARLAAAARFLLAPWSELPALRAVDRRHGTLITEMETRMSADRDLLAAAAVCLPVIADGVLALEQQLATVTRERDEALGREAADEAGDAAEISPLVQGLQALAGKLAPAAAAPDTATPDAPATVEDVPAVVDAAPTAGDGSTSTAATGDTGEASGEL